MDHCENCKFLSNENDLLRRQIALLRSNLILPNSATSDNPVILNGTPKPPVPAIVPTPAQHFVSTNPVCDIVPFHKHPDSLFAGVDTFELDSATFYTHTFNSRSVVYYGQHTYSYDGVTHPPRSLAENPVLLSIVEDVKRKLPDVDFNSVMINRYADGQQSIPFHADNEACIRPDSVITTISLGDSRQLRFRSSINNHVKFNETVHVSHGDVVFMPAASQRLYEHSVPKDFSKKIRLSITLRCIVPSPVATKLQATSSTKGRGLTVYISSSMFSSLDARKLSSDTQDAIVLYYRGATAGVMLDRLKSDNQFLGIDSCRVSNIILMCGTNNVDIVLGTPKRQWTSYISGESRSPDKLELDRSKDDISHLIDFLHGWGSGAIINLVNILPRVSCVRNQTINELNHFISSLCDNNSYTHFISTEVDRYLFCDRKGFRKNEYFNSYGEDNVHLNKQGIIKLSKHLKYCAHH